MGVYGLEKNKAGGIHIHTGKSCSNPGGHYWDESEVGTADPWLTVKYRSNLNGVASGSVKIQSGHSLRENVGHAVVLHDSTGTKIACGLLGNQIQIDTILNADKASASASGNIEEKPVDMLPIILAVVIGAAVGGFGGFVLASKKGRRGSPQSQNRKEMGIEMKSTGNGRNTREIKIDVDDGPSRTKGAPATPTPKRPSTPAAAVAKR